MPPLPVPPLSATATSSSSSGTASTSASATLPAQSLPPLPRITVNDDTLSRISPPLKRIGTDADAAHWIRSSAHALYLLFVQRVAEACVGKPTPPLPPRGGKQEEKEEEPPFSNIADPVERLLHFLRRIDAWTDEIEPQARPQRFGNLAFRDWGARLEERVDEMHRELLPPRLHAFIPELSPYLLDSFGSFVRIDYGSGHEFCFAAWLCFLLRLGFFDDAEEGIAQQDGIAAASSTATAAATPPTKVEERLGLEVFPLYLDGVWRLQDRYGLEPAGSHGVWGLDDFHFLPYVLGAAQLRAQSALRPAQIVRASSDATLLASLPDKTPSRLIGHRPTLPSSLLFPSSSGSRPASEETVLPNLYLSSLLRIQVLKRGPFHEHSPLLHDISTSVPNFIKTYTGMVKMYTAECIDKRVVVQHFKFGSVGWRWDDDNDGEGGVVGSSMPTSSSSATVAGLGRGTTGLGVPTSRMTASRPVPAGSSHGSGATTTTARIPALPNQTRAPSSTSFLHARTTGGHLPTRTVAPSAAGGGGMTTRTSMAPPPLAGSRPATSSSGTAGRMVVAPPQASPVAVLSTAQPEPTAAPGRADVAAPTPAPTSSSRAAGDGAGTSASLPPARAAPTPRPT